MILIRTLLEEGVEELRYRRHGGGGWRRRSLWRKWEGTWGRDGQGEEERVGERKRKGIDPFRVWHFCHRGGIPLLRSAFIHVRANMLFCVHTVLCVHTCTCTQLC